MSSLYCGRSSRKLHSASSIACGSTGRPISRMIASWKSSGRISPRSSCSSTPDCLYGLMNSAAFIQPICSEFADGRFDAVIDQYAAQVEYGGSYLFILDYSLLPDKDRKFRNNSYI